MRYSPSAPPRDNRSKPTSPISRSTIGRKRIEKNWWPFSENPASNSTIGIWIDGADAGIPSGCRRAGHLLPVVSLRSTTGYRLSCLRHEVSSA